MTDSEESLMVNQFLATSDAVSWSRLTRSDRVSVALLTLPSTLTDHRFDQSADDGGRAARYPGRVRLGSGCLLAHPDGMSTSLRQVG